MHIVNDIISPVKKNWVCGNVHACGLSESGMDRQIGEGGWRVDVRPHHRLRAVFALRDPFPAWALDRVCRLFGVQKALSL